MQRKPSLLKIPVYLNHCESYDYHVLSSIFQQQLDLLEIPADLSGKRILLKPNLISGSAPPLACSNSFFVATAASCLLGRGARVLLGDSPAFGSAAQVLKAQGFSRALAGMDVEYVPFRSGLKRKLACGVSVTVAAEALDCDYFVNLPRIKAHQQAGVTMAVKNVFGIVIGARKAWLHMRHGGTHSSFFQMILDLQQILPPTIVLADGIEVMSGNGPVHGSSLSVGCVGAARSCIALDRAMLDVLEVDRRMVPLALVAEQESLPGSVMEEIDFPQLHPQDFAGSGFQVPSTLNPIRFRPFRYLCSSLKRVVTG